MSRAGAKVLGCVVVLAVLGAACSSDGGGTASKTTTTVKYDVDKGVGSPAAALRAELAGLLQEHALLVGVTTGTQLAGQDPAPATAVLDQNSAALGAVFTRLYDPGTGNGFLDAWRRHAAALIAFGPEAAKDKAATDAAKAAITAVQGELAGLLNTANPQLTTDALKKAFSGYTNSLTSAITAQAKKDPEAPAKLKKAADKTALPAIVLAAGIVKQKKDDVAGSVDGIAAVVRSELTAKLQEHTYLAGLATEATVAGADTTPVSDALDENSLELSRSIGAVYGDDAGRRFLQLWRQHIGFFVDYTEAAAAQNAGGMSAARSALDGYRQSFATFLATANPNVSEEEIGQQLREHVDSVLAAIDAQVAKDPGSLGKLHDAAAHMPATALYLATGIARQFPTKFG